ncbi:hypothetical protein [Acidisoma sp. S159]|uniref:hypothetical protein n=1 Tax=Acidisoma sp. S159 TaxID=1747225 RepID=UPI00131CC161|nr:hypothetical protein [Acidisoma sp. S159]
MEKLRGAIDQPSNLRPCQLTEALIHGIVIEAEALSKLRNKIAHGIVHLGRQGLNSAEFFLVPGYYEHRAIEHPVDPLYAYCAKDIKQHAESFRSLANRTSDLRSKLSPV